MMLLSESETYGQKKLPAQWCVIQSRNVASIEESGWHLSQRLTGNSGSRPSPSRWPQKGGVDGVEMFWGLMEVVSVAMAYSLLYFSQSYSTFIKPSIIVLCPPPPYIPTYIRYLFHRITLHSSIYRNLNHTIKFDTSNRSIHPFKSSSHSSFDPVVCKSKQTAIQEIGYKSINIFAPSRATVK